MKPLACARRTLGSVMGLSVVTVAWTARAADLTAPTLPDVWSGTPSLAAAPAFRWNGDAGTRQAAAQCLATAVYYEAGGEPLAGREAVAQVVLNRVRHPAYPKSVCGVVYQGAPSRGCQFTFACDGSLDRTPDPRGWRNAQDVASRALDGFTAVAVGLSTHYHTLAAHPAWSAMLTPTVQIGAHQFYRFRDGGAALSQAYSGVEPAGMDRIGLRPSRTVPSLHAETSAIATTAPQAATFSVWGLQVARVTPRGGGVAVVGPPT